MPSRAANWIHKVLNRAQKVHVETGMIACCGLLERPEQAFSTHKYLEQELMCAFAAAPALTMFKCYQVRLMCGCFWL